MMMLLVVGSWCAGVLLVVAFMVWRSARERRRRQAEIERLERRWGRPARAGYSARVHSAPRRLRRDDDSGSVMDSAPLWGEPPSAPDCSSSDNGSSSCPGD